MTAMVFLAIIFIGIYIAYKILLESRIKRYWLKTTVDIVLTMIAIPILVNLLMPIFNLEEQRRNDAFQRTVTNAIVGKGLDRKELEDLIVRQRKDIFQSTEDEAQKFVKNLLSREPEIRQEVSVLRDKTKELSDKLHLKWKPTTKYILDAFDQRLIEIKKHKERVEFERYINDFDLVVDLDIEPYTETEIRKVNFPNGSSISVKFGAGQIQQGIFLGHLNLVFKEIPPPPIRDTVAFAVWCFDSYSTILTENNRYKNIRFKTDNDPLDNEEFINKINLAINQLITNIYLY